MPQPSPTTSVLLQDLLLKLTGQTEVSEPDHARALLGVAIREEAEARQALERTRWPLRRARFRMLPVVLRMPPLVASLLISSALIFAGAMVLIAVRLAGVVELIALISVGYTLGFGVTLYLLNDGPDETDENRGDVRRRELSAALEAREAAAAKLARLERETQARQKLVEDVITFSFEAARRKRQEALKATPKPPPAEPEPKPEYGGG